MRRVVAAAMGLVSSVWSIGLLAAFGGVGHPIRVAHADDLAEKAFFTIVVDGEAAPAEMTEMIVTCPPGTVAVSGGLDVVELEDSVYFRTYTSAPMIDGVPITLVEDGTYPTSSAWRLRVKNTKDGPLTRTLNLDGGIQRHSVQCREDEAAVRPCKRL